MKPAKWRLLLAAVLFVGWLAYLIVLAVRTEHPAIQFWPLHFSKSPPVVLSRPQFLVAGLVVVAEVSADAEGRPEAEVTVVRVYGPENRPANPPDKIAVRNLPSTTGWQGPGQYILALVPTAQPDGSTTYEVAPTPPSPGYEPGSSSPRIYPATPETLLQLEEILKHE